MGISKEIKQFFVPTEDGADRKEEEGRFVLTGHQLLGGMVICTVTDRKTGVSYVTKPGNDCPLTPLLDENGRPYLEG